MEREKRLQELKSAVSSKKALDELILAFDKFNKKCSQEGIAIIDGYRNYLNDQKKRYEIIIQELKEYFKTEDPQSSYVHVKIRPKGNVPVKKREPL